MASGTGPLGNLIGKVNATNQLEVAVSGAGSGGTSSTDDADFTAGGSAGTAAMGVFESAPTSVTDGDLGIVGITALRELKVDITSNTAGIGGGTAYTEDVVTADPQVGSAIMMERDDALSTVTPVEADWIGLRGTARGALWVQHDQSVALDVSAAIVPVKTEEQLDYNTGGGNTLSMIGLALPGAAGPVAGGTTTNPLVVNLGANNDVTLATLPDTAAGDLAAIKTAVEGTLTVTGGGGGTEYTEDAIAAVDPVGTVLILVREDARAGSLTTADNDNVALRGNNKGEAYVLDTDANALLTTIDADTGTIAGDTTSLDGKVTACNTGAVVLSSGTVTTVSTVTNLSQMGGVAISLNTGVRDTGTQRVTIATNDVVPVSGTVTANPASGTIDTVTNLAQMGGVAISLNTGVRDTGTQRVTIATNDVVPVSGTVTANAGTGTRLVEGEVAHSAADVTANPVRIGAHALSADLTAVTTGDTTDLIASLLGKLVTLPYALPAATWYYAAASGGIADTTAVTVRAAQAAGIINYVTSMQVMNGDDTVGTEVLILDGAAGTPMWRGWCEQTGGGVSAKFDPPLRGTAATLVEVDVVTTSAIIYFNLQGYSAAE